PWWGGVRPPDCPEPSPEPPKETNTTPAPTAKMARPRISIWVDRRIAMGSPSDGRAWPRGRFWRLGRAEQPLTSFVGRASGIPDSSGGSFGRGDRTSARDESAKSIAACRTRQRRAGGGAPRAEPPPPP